MSYIKKFVRKMNAYIESNRYSIKDLLATLTTIYAISAILFLSAHILFGGFAWYHVFQMFAVVTATYLALKQSLDMTSELLTTFVVFTLIAIGTGGWIDIAFLVSLALVIVVDARISTRKKRAT